MLKQDCGFGSALLWEAGSGSGAALESIAGSGSGSSKFRRFKGSRWSHRGPWTHKGGSKWSHWSLDKRSQIRTITLMRKRNTKKLIRIRIKVQGIRIRIILMRIPKERNHFLALEKRSGMIKPDPLFGFFFHPSPGSGSRDQKSTISWICNTGWNHVLLGILFVP